MIKPILPPYVEFGAGKIVDSRGQESSEIDVIIFSRQTLPPLVFEHGFGIYPVEACIYAIEVKSQINSTEIRCTIEKFKSLRSLYYLPPVVNVGYEATPRVIPVLFAFGSDLSSGGKDELQRYRELDPEADSNPIVPVISVARRGYWWFNEHEPAKKWIEHLSSDH